MSRISTADPDVFTQTVTPLVRTAKRSGATVATLTQAFLEAVHSLYGSEGSKEVTAAIGFQHLLDSEGGSVSAAGAAKLYGGPAGCTDEAVRKEARLGHLVVIRDGRGNLHFPVWQFGARGGTLPGLRETLDILRKYPHFDDLTPATFFLNPSARLGGRMPIEALRDGNENDRRLVSELAVAAGE